jgi:hypothetical protein
MATITFTDSVGAATIANQAAAPGNRLSNWTPTLNKVADRRFALGTGIAFEYVFREDFLASFTLEGLPATELEKVSRLVRHAQAGNTFVINTMDNSARSYTVRMAEGSEIDVSMTDRTFCEYSLSMTVANANSPKVFMTVEYL